MSFHDHARAALAQLSERALLRTPRALQGPQGPDVQIAGRSVVCLCSNNYLGLATHPALAAAATAALAELGFGAAASRHISGTMAPHVAAEARLARFVNQTHALLFSSGYAANVGAIQALADRDTLLFSDELNHASLIDGCRLSRARVHVYHHNDPQHLARLLAQHRGSAKAALVITESVFSMDGDLADLRALRSLCDQYDCALLVDEAHALGVLGPQGRGLGAREGVTADLLVGTLGKAFGASGAFVAGSEALVRLIENRARSYVFSTAPAPALAAAAIAAVDLVEAAEAGRARLLAHATYLRGALRELGYQVLDGESCVLPVIIGAEATTMALSARLLEHGVFVHGIRPPTVPAGTSRLRVTPMATHTPEHLIRAVSAFAAARG